MLTSEERARNAKLLSSHFAKNSTESPAPEKPATQEEQPRRSSRGRSKSPHRTLVTKSPKSATPSGKVSVKNQCHINGSPANHIASLLLKEIMCQDPDTSKSPDVFLSTLDCMDMLADLVLAVPACGAAIHRYQPCNEFQNALSGCPSPPQTAVSFILHKLLPQPREDPKPEVDIALATDSDKTQALEAYNKTKISQAGARLIVCLVARSGEGRRRVIADLVLALSCGQHPIEQKADSSSTIAQKPPDESSEMWALSAWGDLCMGLASPRSTDAPLSGQDSNSSLSFGVVKLMLEAGAPFALMAALQRIGLHHPRSSSVASSIIKPLELLTRPSVYTAVEEMAKKEKAKLEASKTSKESHSRRTTFGPSQRTESDIYDQAMDDAFANTRGRHMRDGAEDSLDESMENGESMDEEEESMDDSDSEASSEIEVRLGNVDYSDEESVNEDEDDEEVSSEEDESSSDEEDESDGESDEEIDDGAERFSDESGDEEEEQEDEEIFFDDGVNPIIEGDRDGMEAGEGDAEEDAVDDGMMEGWTRIDNGGGPRAAAGLRDMLLDMVQPHALGAVQNGNFLMDAAETMLGNILRGDLGLDPNELEDSLGIRVMRGERGAGGVRGGAPGIPAGLTNRNPPSGLVHQSTPGSGSRNLSETR